MDIMKYLSEMAARGLKPADKNYLAPLKTLIDLEKIPRDMILNDLNWCKILKLN